ncbi:MAG: hypothetical protein PHW25_02510 [Zoogloea sp.]|uniref:hypothetical protein n=1 Tax=Zoogloea sp. TaxID=49181 RepID=UPI0026146B8C|nr:hypothetical protein [Zoogloea sp.]MDD3325939.1 hypothetical protein [Zoogloea sp.]
MENHDDPTADGELLATLQALRDEVRGLAGRVAELEGCLAAAGIRPPPAAPAAVAPTPPEPQAAGISEEELLAISAAVAAYLGVRAHIRQVRLIQSTTWGQIGRLNVHASHQRRH